MLSNFFILIKIGRALARSNSLSVFEEFYKPPLSIKILMRIFSLTTFNKDSENKSPGERLKNSFLTLGPAFIKLGQFLATRPDIVGQEFSQELQKLQDQMPAFDISQSKDALRKELGEEKYQQITYLSKPIAAASIAQVHFAKIINNEKKEIDVAIKILRPNIEKIFHKELDALRFLASIIEFSVKKSRRLKLVKIIDLLKEITNIEMDLRYEAAAASELKKNTNLDEGFKVPSIFWDFTGQRVLTIEKVEGISIKDKELLIKNKIDLKKISRLLIQNFLRQAVGDGFFHGDMHQGNLFVDKNENIVPVDFGIMGRLDLANRKYLAEILYGFINRDYEKVAKVHFIAGLIPNTESIDNFTQALRTIGEPIFGQSARNISAGKLLARLFEVTEKFNMATQPQLLLLQKTMVVVEGVARSLDEDANIWEISKPVLQGWLNNEIGPKNRIDKILRTTTELLDKLPELPEMINRANKAMELLNSYEFVKNQNQNNEYQINKEFLKLKKTYLIIGLLIIVIILLIVFK
ncbi:MAG: 2-polyprenylphenol 6-hydroxylase [Pseudomonadota bacterium]|jgi:ubiquinone biosynthesis protein